jgi:hypothetical protein
MVRLTEVFKGTRWNIFEDCNPASVWGKAVIDEEGAACLACRGGNKAFECIIDGNLRSSVTVKWCVKHTKKIHTATLLPALCSFQKGEIAWRGSDGGVIYWKRIDKDRSKADADADVETKDRSLKRKRSACESELSTASTACPWDTDERPDKYDPVSKRGRFFYTKQLGKGAHGVVLEAVDMWATEGSPLMVAVKVPHKDTQKARDQLQREYSWSHTMLHSGDDARGCLFLKYLEAQTGPESKTPYLVMELAKGTLAWDALFAKASPSVSTPQKRKVLYQLVRALTYLAELKLLHRDLRFHNLCLTRNFELTILDFGLMGRLGEVKGLAAHTKEGWRKLDWIPWEARHLNGVDEKPNVEHSHHAFDIFSLGVIHLYMCLGQSETREILQRIELGNRAFKVDNPKGLVFDAATSLRMLSKDPSERPSPSELEKFLGPYFRSVKGA